MYPTTRFYPEEYLNTVTQTLKCWTENIINKKNFSFIKFGDGEFYCMLGTPGYNCDQHPYSKILGEKLNLAWNYFCSSKTHEIYIAEWADQPGSFGTPQNILPQKNPHNPIFSFYNKITENKELNFKLVNFEILLQNTLSLEKYNFFKTLKNIDRNKVFIGPERLNKVQSFLNINTHIQVPLHNTFSKYDDILNACKNLYKKNTIFIFSSGMPTKSLIFELIKEHSDITCLDTGSSFDALFVGGTREGQLNTDTLLTFYKDLL